MNRKGYKAWRLLLIGLMMICLAGTALGEDPAETPAETPTEAPTETPTEAPTEAPTETPTEAPTVTPTEASTEAPTVTPTEAPTVTPTEAPTEVPTETPVEEVPTVTPAPVQPEQPIVVNEVLPVAPEQVAEVQWERKNQETDEWEEIAGATEIVYIPTREDEGSEVRARVALVEVPDVPVYTDSFKIQTLTGGDYAVTGSSMDEVPKTGPRSVVGGVFAAIGVMAMAAMAVVTLKSRKKED